MSHFLESSRLFFRPLEIVDLPVTQKWLEDREVVKYLHRGIFPTSLAQVQETFEKTRANPTEVEFGLCDLKTGLLIGVLGLYGMDSVSRVAELRILIGNKTFWGKGIGKEATELLCQYGFNSLNLHKIFLGVNADNVSAVQCYLKTGFVKEGLFRKEFFYEGKYSDSIRMGILKEEYLGLKK